MYKYIGTKGVIHSTLDSGEDIFIKDQWKREYHFKIASFELPNAGLISEAIEVKEDNSPGYYFKIVSDINEDQEWAQEQLIKKIKRGLNRRHIKKRGNKWSIGERMMLCGRIEWNDDFEDTQYDRVFIIDGKRITLEEFNQMLEEWEGWHFQLKILDAFDEST
jgi:hypothetical protein